MLEVQLLDVIEVGNTLGEGVQWNAQDQSVWWTDIQACRLYRLGWPNRQLEVFQTPERLCAFAFSDRPDCIIAAFASGFALYNYRRGEILWQKTLLADDCGLRFNDGGIDRQGRFWAGTMVEDSSRADAASAALYRLERDGSVAQVAGDIQISNGCSWSPQGDSFYFADTPRREIYRYDFDPGTGGIGKRQLFARSMMNRYPDGATVDSEGYLWSAQWRGARVERYAPDGSSAGAVTLPASQITCAAFGGPKMDLLFVTSARDSLPQWTLDRERLAGSLFVLQTPFRGVEDTQFAAEELHGTTALLHSA